MREGGGERAASVKIVNATLNEAKLLSKRVKAE